MTKPPLNAKVRFRHNGHEATIVAHTERGFKYLLAHTYPFIPRWGMSFSGEGEIFTDVEGYDWAADIEYVESFSEGPFVGVLQQVTFPQEYRNAFVDPSLSHPL